MDITNKLGPTNRRKCELGLVILYKLLLFLLFMNSICQGEGLNRSCINSCSHSPWEKPYPDCVNHVCVCANNQCVHYTSNTNGFVTYFCGVCGDVGSDCSNHSCKFPGECYHDDFCHCNTGYLYQDICVHYQAVTTSVETIILCIIFIALLLLNRVISSYKSIVKCFKYIFCCTRCREGCCQQSSTDEDTAYGYNPESGNKSAAFTISSREFLSSSEDPELDWALELSAQLANQQNELEDGPNRLRRINAIRRAYPRGRNSYRRISSGNEGRGSGDEPSGAYSQASCSSRGSTRSTESSQISFQSVTSFPLDNASTGSSSGSPSRATRHGGKYSSDYASKDLGDHGWRYYSSDYASNDPGEEIILTDIIRRPRVSSSSAQPPSAVPDHVSNGLGRNDSFPATLRRKRITVSEFLKEEELLDHEAPRNIEDEKSGGKMPAAADNTKVKVEEIEMSVAIDTTRIELEATEMTSAAEISPNFKPLTDVGD